MFDWPIQMFDWRIQMFDWPIQMFDWRHCLQIPGEFCIVDGLRELLKGRGADF